MQTKPAKMYSDDRIEERTPTQIVRTIKAQLQVKGKSSTFIRVNATGDTIVIDLGPDFYFVHDDPYTMVYYVANTNSLFVIGTNFAFCVHP